MSAIARKSAAPVKASAFDAETDIVVVGGGGVGLATALFSRWLGNEVVLLEKAPKSAAPPRKRPSGTGCPTTSRCRRWASRTSKDDCIRYMARLSRPEVYHPDHPRFGMSQWEYDCLRRDLRQRLDGDRAARREGRARIPPLRRRARLLGRAARGQGADRPRASAQGRARHDVGWRRASRSAPWRQARAEGRRRHPHRPPRAARHRERCNGASSASRPTLPTARPSSSRHARRSSSPRAASPTTSSMRKNHLSVPVFGGCAARTNEGDFVHIGSRRRRRPAQHELFLDVPDRAGEGAQQGSFADRHVLAVRRLDDLCRQERPARHQREACLQRVGAGVLQVGSGEVGISEPGPDRDLGPTQPGSFGERRIWPLHRARRAPTIAHVIKGKTWDDARRQHQEARSRNMPARSAT